VKAGTPERGTERGTEVRRSNVALVCVCEFQKLAIVAMKSLPIWLASIKTTITRAWLPITPGS